MNICYCGSQAGYPHAADCPYPFFRGTVEDEDDWYAARAFGTPATANPDIAQDKAASPFFAADDYR